MIIIDGRVLWLSWTSAALLSYQLGEKNFLQNSLDVGMNLKKGWKQGREENTQEDYPTT